MSTQPKFYKLIIAYDGTDFAGWQSQTHSHTIQCQIKDSFVRSFARTCTLFGASRTDAGVHALGQVARLKTTVDIEPGKLAKVLNACLPASIKVADCQRASEGFNPHANIDHKVYRYTIFTSKACPTVARFGWRPPFVHRVDWQRFEQCMALYPGTHNFNAFCRIEPGEVKQVVRSVESVTCQWTQPDRLDITIKGHSFLRYQIRRMVGAAFEVARKKSYGPQVIGQSLATGESLPPQVAFNAPGCGLTLVSIVYAKD